MEHDFYINGLLSNHWGLFFMEGSYQELVKAPKRKISPLTLSLNDQNGEETDRTFNKYESKSMSLRCGIKASNQEELIQVFDRFVNEVILAGGDITLDSTFLNRRFILRYADMTGLDWGDSDVVFNLELVDDFPADIKPIQ